MKNSYAAQLAARKQAEKIEIIAFAVQKTLDFVTVALNEEYHFGPDRQNRVAKIVNELWEEYDRMINAGGVEYAEEKVRQRLEKIMGAKSD